MDISEHLTQQKLQEIMMNIYIKSIEAENVQVKDLIEEIKKQVLADSK
ncbi:hypothetical protein MLOOGBEN_00515 [Bacillus sp. EB106-08-02-XG196]|jgi:hypothetical protein|nr:hypothetical protein [Bacillus sp. EB106-08-02-XG196]NWQ39177.1 hypothetical protein [Bacillus sp. EB106-08-02-XG196]